MKYKKLIVSIIVVAFIVPVIAISYLFLNDRGSIQRDDQGGIFDVKKITYNIEGNSYYLATAPNSVLTMFGEPVFGDLDSDGDLDAAVLLAHAPGGSGTFYYASFAINNGNGYKSTNSFLLGDRIAPQTVEYHDGTVVYNFAVRKDGEPMTARPSVGKSVWVSFDASSGLITGSDNDGSSI